MLNYFQWHLHISIDVLLSTFWVSDKNFYNAYIEISRSFHRYVFKILSDHTIQSYPEYYYSWYNPELLQYSKSTESVNLEECKFVWDGAVIVQLFNLKPKPL